jgi:hypothetical protein
MKTAGLIVGCLAASLTAGCLFNRALGEGIQLSGEGFRGAFTESLATGLLTSAVCVAEVVSEGGAWVVRHVSFTTGGATYVRTSEGGSVVEVRLGGRSAQLSARKCSRFAVGQWIDEAKNVHARIELECREGGFRIRGEVHSDVCFAR